MARVDLRDETLQLDAAENVEVDGLDLHRAAEGLGRAAFDFRLERRGMDEGVEPERPDGYS